MIHLPSIILICVDTLNYGKAVSAIQKSLKQITPAKAVFMTDIPYQSDEFETVIIPTLGSVDDYSKFMLKELYRYIPEVKNTSHVLIIQHDGYVLDADQWTDDFLKYSYLGAPWPRVDKYRIGNGGFSLRSLGLIRMVAQDNFIKPLTPEDNVIAILYRDYLESKGCIWPPEELAHRFAYELIEPRMPSFGFHGNHHPPYRPYIVIKRTGALGDVVALEPVLAWYHENGYNVVLDSPYIDLFMKHYDRWFTVRSWDRFDRALPHKVIDLDMAYEVRPRQLHLKSYFEMCGITDYTLRNPRLYYPSHPSTNLFNKYVIVHIDERDTAHRNIYGIDWRQVEEFLASKGCQVIQIGRSHHQHVGTWVNTPNTAMMMWLIAGAELFIGIDSGPANIAAALGKKCLLFFGSVNPMYIYHDLKDITVLQSPCPFGRQYCWHEEPGTSGSICDKPEEPPCCVHETEMVINDLNDMGV